MKRVKIVLFAVIGIILTSMTVYDLLPYRERNYVTHAGSTSQSFDLVFNSTYPWIEISVDPFIDIQDPFPDTINTLLFSASINVSYHISSSEWTASLYSPLGYVDCNTTETYHNADWGNNQRWFQFYNNNRTDFAFFFTYTANYSLEMIYTRPPKTYAWETLRSFLTTEGVIFACVVLIASILVYVSVKIARDS
ncbi:MAG: hypothetical protein ACFFF9_13775 [Candidatus Thorarchaeota archaeon]